MATLKHINSKNADYGAAEQYLLFEHDEYVAGANIAGFLKVADAMTAQGIV